MLPLLWRINVTTFFIWMIGIVCTFIVLSVIVELWEPIKSVLWLCALFACGIFGFITAVQHWPAGSGSQVASSGVQQPLEIPDSVVRKYEAGMLPAHLEEKLENAAIEGRVNLPSSAIRQLARLRSQETVKQ